MALAGKYADLLHLIGEFSVGIVAEFAQLKERFITHDKEIATLRASVATLESAHNKLIERCKTLEEANIALCGKVARLEQCVIISDASANCAKECAIIERAIEEFIMRLPQSEPQHGSCQVNLNSLESRQFAIYKTILYLRANPNNYIKICRDLYSGHHIAIGWMTQFMYFKQDCCHGVQWYSPLFDEIAAKYKLSEIWEQYRKFR